MAKLDDRCFCYFTTTMFVSLQGAQTWRHHTKLYKFEWNTSLNNGRMKNRTDLNLGEVVYISIIFHMPASWLNSLNSYDFYFWWCDTANQPYNMQTIWTWSQPLHIPSSACHPRKIQLIIQLQMIIKPTHKILSVTHRKCQSKPNIWILPPLLQRIWPFWTVSGSNLLTYHLPLQQEIWLAVYSRSSLIGVTYLSLTHPLTHP